VFRTTKLSLFITAQCQKLGFFGLTKIPSRLIIACALYVAQSAH